MVPSINRLGFVCLALIGALFALSIPLHCGETAAAVALTSAFSGVGLGLALAMVTRTRAPLGIYVWLAMAAVTVIPLFRAWPPADSFDVNPWRGAPEIFYNYFDFLRGGAFLLGMPYPFARLGLHGPDSDRSEPLDKSGLQP